MQGNLSPSSFRPPIVDPCSQRSSYARALHAHFAERSGRQGAGSDYLQLCLAVATNTWSSVRPHQTALWSWKRDVDRLRGEGKTRFDEGYLPGMGMLGRALLRICVTTEVNCPVSTVVRATPKLVKITETNAVALGISPNRVKLFH